MSGVNKIMVYLTMAFNKVINILKLYQIRPNILSSRVGKTHRFIKGPTNGTNEFIALLTVRKFYSFRGEKVFFGGGVKRISRNYAHFLNASRLVINRQI